jgi:hypothetical protein
MRSATHGASRVASVFDLSACCRHYSGGIPRCSLRSLPLRWQPSREFWRVGFRFASFEPRSAFTRVTARILAQSQNNHLHQGLQPLLYHCGCSDCYRLERMFAGRDLHPLENRASVRRTK